MNTPLARANDLIACAVLTGRDLDRLAAFYDVARVRVDYLGEFDYYVETDADLRRRLYVEIKNS